jgi:hypothetical protein
LKKSMTVFQGPAGSRWQLGPTPSTMGSGAFIAFVNLLCFFVDTERLSDPAGIMEVVVADYNYRSNDYTA